MFYIFTFLLLISSNLSADFEYDTSFFQQSIGAEDEYFRDELYEDTELKITTVKKEPDYHRDFGEAKNRVKIQNGVDKAFYPDGKLRFEIGYVAGRKDGVEKYFYSDGKLKSEIGYRNGRKDGMEKIFYSDGKLKSETGYRDDRKDGMEKIFNPDGRVKSEIIYRSGRVMQVVFRGY